MATGVMGWHLEEEYVYRGTVDNEDRRWFDENGDFQAWELDWQPDTSIAQAMMCAEKFIDDSMLYVQLSTKTWLQKKTPQYSAYLHDVDGKWIGGFVKDALSLAICSVIIEVMK